MAKAKDPNASVLILKLRGFSAWAGKAGYAKAFEGARSLLSAIGTASEAWGGSLVAFEGEAAYALFGPGAAAGVPEAVRAGQAALPALKEAAGRIEGVLPAAAVHAFLLPQTERNPKGGPGPAGAKESVRAAARTLEALKPGDGVFLSVAAAAAAGKTVSVHPAGKAGAQVLALRATAAKPAGKPRPSGASPDDLSAARLKPLQKLEQVPFSILAVRASRIDPAAQAPAAGALKDAFQTAVQIAETLDGKVLPESGDSVAMLFPGREAGEEAARNALMAAFSALGLLPRIKPPWIWGAGVASGTASFDQVERRVGDLYRRVLGEARTLAQPRRGCRSPFADEATRSRTEAVFEARVPVGGSRGPGRFEIPDLDPGAFFRARLGIRGSLPAELLKASGKKIREAFSDAEKENAFWVTGLQGESEAARALGALFLVEEARRRGWKVLFAPCDQRLSLHPLAPWKTLAAGIAGVLPSTPADETEDLFGRALEQQGFRGEEFLPKALRHLFHLPEADPGSPWSADPALRRRMAEKGILLLLSGAAAKEPVLVLLQDLQWSDSSSIEFMLRVRDLLKGRPGLLACVYGPPAEPANLDFEFSLPLPGAQEGPVLAREILGGGEPGKEVRDLASRLGHDPFRLAETIAALREKGALRLEGGRWTLAHGEKPPGQATRALAQKRLAALPAGERKALGTAAHLGPWFDAASFGAAKIAEPFKALRSLEDAGWLIRGPSAARGEWGWRHGEAQAVAAGILSAKEKAEVHARAAEALRGRPGSESPEGMARIAWHRRAVGDRAGQAAVLRALGVWAKDAGFPAEAEACFREAGELPREDEIGKAGFLCDRAEALLALGRTDEALAGLASALKLKSLSPAKKQKPVPVPDKAPANS